MMNFSEQDQLGDIEKKMMSDAEIMLTVIVFSILYTFIVKNVPKSNFYSALLANLIAKFDFPDAVGP